jgi:putative DNA primase/helicase
LVLRHYPRGNRHSHALVIGGFLARAGWTPEEISHLVEVVARAADDEEWQERAKSAAGAVAKLGKGEPVSGVQSLRDTWGDIVADTLSHWLDIRPAGEAREGRHTGDQRTLTTRSVASFKPRKLSWLWKPFIPYGMSTCMFGDGDIGKSTILLDIAARISTGEPMPSIGGVTKKSSKPRSVLILGKEEDVPRIVRPRLEAARADLKRVHIVGYEVPGAPDDFDPIDRLDTKAKELEELVQRHRDVDLIIIEAIDDFLGKLDMYSDADVRTLLAPLGRLAARHDLAVTFILHLNKSTEQAAKHRGLGSIAFRNVPRSRLLVAKDSVGQHFMVQEKGNYSRSDERAVSFELVSAPTNRAVAIVEWGTEWEKVDPDDLVAAKKLSKQRDAVVRLREWLADGPVHSDELRKRARELDISPRTLDLAKKVLGVQSKKHRSGGWFWHLPK